MVDSVEIRLLPEAFVLQRRIGEKYNDPALLEEKDFEDFYAEFQGGRSFAFGQMRNLSLYTVGRRIQENHFSPQPYNSDYLLMLRGAFHAIQFVSELAPQEETCDQISPEDITALAAIMGDEATALVRAMEETFAAAQQGAPYVFSDNESFRDFPEYLETTDFLEGLVPEIFSEYSRRFGRPNVLPAPPIGGIEVYYSEVEDGRFRISEMIAEVGVHPLLVKKYGDIHILRHELNHLWLALSFGGNPFCWAEAVEQAGEEWSLRWFHEGLATYAAGEKSARRNYVFANHSPVMLANFVNSISTSLFETAPNYFFPTLLFEIWVEEHGESLIGKLMDEAEGNELGMFNVMRNLLYGGRNFPDYIADIQRRATTKIREMYSDEEMESYIGILEALLPGIRQEYESGNWRMQPYRKVATSLERLGSANALLETTPADPELMRFSALCDDFLEKYPDAVFSLAVRYLAGVIHFRLGDGEKAREHFAEILKDPSQFIHRAEEAIFYSAVAEARWGEKGVTALDEIIPYLSLPLRDLAEEVKEVLSGEPPPPPPPPPPRPEVPASDQRTPADLPAANLPAPDSSAAEEEGGCQVSASPASSLRHFAGMWPRRR